MTGPDYSLPDKRKLYGKTFIALALFVFTITFIIYLPALQNGFVNWDDDKYVYENLSIRSIDSNFFRSLFTDSFNVWHPLTIISHALDYAVWGLNPQGHHFTSVFLHSLNALFVFFLSAQLMSDCALQDGKSSKKIMITALATALLFAIHPLHVEPVVWVSGRKDLLCTFFFLLSLIFYCQFTLQIKGRKYLFYSASLISLQMALMSKPMALSLPLILLLFDIYPLNRLTVSGGIMNAKRIFFEKLPFFLLSAVSASIVYLSYHSDEMVKSLSDVSIAERLLLVSRSYTFYLYKMVFPLTLTPRYPDPENVSFLNIDYLGPFIFFLAITLFAVSFIRRNRPLFFAWIYFLVALIPVAGIIQSGIPALADRYTYLPSLGPFLLAGLGVGVFFEKTLIKYPKRQF